RATRASTSAATGVARSGTFATTSSSTACGPPARPPWPTASSPTASRSSNRAALPSITIRATAARSAAAASAGPRRWCSNSWIPSGDELCRALARSRDLARRLRRLDHRRLRREHSRAPLGQSPRCCARGPPRQQGDRGDHPAEFGRCLRPPAPRQWFFPLPARPPRQRPRRPRRDPLRLQRRPLYAGAGHPQRRRLPPRLHRAGQWPARGRLRPRGADPRQPAAHPRCRLGGRWRQRLCRAVARRIPAPRRDRRTDRARCGHLLCSGQRIDGRARRRCARLAGPPPSQRCRPRCHCGGVRRRHFSLRQVFQMTMTPAELRERAFEVLRENDRGTYTVPTKGLYPFQWNWDSCLTALGQRHFDEARAWTEIETLFQHQWPDGMVPHIVFHAHSDGYFPGPDVWNTGRPIPTSGITQPPVAGFAVRRLFDQAKDKALAAERAGRLVARIDAWHRWFYEARDPHGEGLVALLHPWESGRDNSIDWDEAFERVPTEGVQPYTRRDTQHADPAHRPTKAQYDRYIWLVERFRGLGWDNGKLHDASPFQVVDPGFNAILLRSAADLAA